jgi:exopolyphosphatase/guanosine-5'-triphosphate,3'-diphosphate pyrophosphatase
MALRQALRSYTFPSSIGGIVRRDVYEDERPMAHDAASVRPRAGPKPGTQGRKPPPARWDTERRTYAALDLGTNNCRLLIARPSPEGFTIIDAFSRIVRLGEGLATSGRLSDAAIERAIAALSICADKLKRRHVTLVRSVATEACRRAENGRDFVGRVHAETGIRLEVIGPGEEARLAVLGCQALLPSGEGPALIFDIGGGSTELVLCETIEDGTCRILDWFSAPWGVVSLTEAEGGTRADDAAQALAAYRRMKARVAGAFADFATTLPKPESPPRLLGTSGTVTTLASLHLGLPAYDRRAVDGLVVPADAMRDISTRLSGMTVAERATVPCVGNERADLVVAGCAILEAILDLWPADRLGVADRGIREGILRSLIARDAVIR